MTVHKDYANKSCPGKYLYDRHGEIAAEVNKRLGADEPKVETPATTSAIKKGDVVSINSDSATYYDGKKKVPAWVRKKKWIVKEVKGDRAVIDQSQASFRILYQNGIDSFQSFLYTSIFFGNSTS